MSAVVHAPVCKLERRRETDRGGVIITLWTVAGASQENSEQCQQLLKVVLGSVKSQHLSRYQIMTTISLCCTGSMYQSLGRHLKGLFPSSMNRFILMTVHTGLEPPGWHPNQSSLRGLMETRTDGYQLSVNKHKRPCLPNASGFWNNF